MPFLRELHELVVLGAALAITFFFFSCSFGICLPPHLGADPPAALRASSSRQCWLCWAGGAGPGRSGDPRWKGSPRCVPGITEGWERNPPATPLWVEASNPRGRVTNLTGPPSPCSTRKEVCIPKEAGWLATGSKQGPLEPLRMGSMGKRLPASWLTILPAC